MKSRKRDEIRASPDEIFGVSPQVKFNPPYLSPRSGISSRSDFIHRRWISFAKGGFSRKKHTCFADVLFSGGDNWNRTSDPLHVKQVL